MPPREPFAILQVYVRGCFFRTIVTGLAWMDVIFKELLTSLMSLLYSEQFQALKTLVMGGNRMDVIFQLATCSSCCHYIFQAISHFKNS